MHIIRFVRDTLKYCCVGMLTLLCVCGARAQVAGTFDTTFGATNGYVSALAVGTNADDRAYAMALQPDGKIVLAGQCAGALGTFFCMARLNADGSLDSSFDGPGTPGNGKFLLSVAGSISAGAYAVAVQPDGKILVAGNCSGKFCIARLNEGGSFDTTFTGIGGNSAGHFAVTIGPATDTLSAMALQPDGMIVLAGSCDDGTGNARTQYCVARLTATGDFDTTFDGPPPVAPANGRFLVPRVGSNATYPERAEAMRVTVAGKVLLAGQCRSADVTICLVQLNANGSFDTTFDGISSTGNGKVVLDTEVGHVGISRTKIALQADDHILIAGDCTNYGCIVRIKPDGIVDLSFGGGALYSAGKTRTGTVTVHDAVAVQADGRILIAGSQFHVTRLNGDGSPDNAFDGPAPSTADGFIVNLAVSPYQQELSTMELQPDGKILLAGYCKSSAAAPVTFCVARLNPGSSGARNCTPDVDGDGRTMATVDGLILTRVMLGMTGNAVTNGISFPVSAPRKTWSAIRSYLATQCGMTLGP